MIRRIVPVAMALALLTVAVLLHVSRRMDLADAIRLDLRPLDWLLLACLPVVMALLATAVARAAALWGLARAP